MAGELNKYLRELPLYNDLKPGDLLLVYDKTNGVDKAIDAVNVLPVSEPSQNYRWIPSNEYSIDELVESGGDWWKSIVNGNQGNVPTEGLGYWEKVTKSASGFVMWQSGYFTQNEAFVLNYLDGYLQFFRLNSGVRPYNSTNFELEYASGDWELASERGYIGIVKPAHGFALNNVLTNVAGSWVKYNGANGKPLAIVKSVIDVDTVIVVLLGERIKTFAGLTPGAVYYAQANGTIGTPMTTDAVMVAVSATDAVILLGGGGGGTIALGPLFPKVYFTAPAPYGNDATGVPGDFSKPYTPAGAIAAAALGDFVTFLPGYFPITSNLAKDGVAFTTFGGAVTLEVTAPGVCAFDYSASNSTEPVFISGSFRGIVNAVGASFFKGNDAAAADRSHVLEFSLIDCISGVYGIVLPRFSTASRINGQINTWAGFTGCACSTPLSVNNARAKGGTINLNIYNETTVPAFEHINFDGYIVTLNMYAASTGGFSINFGTVVDCVWTMNIKQPAGTTSRMPSGGSFNVMLDGGDYDFRGNGKIQVDGAIRNANVLFNVTNGVYLSGRLDTCFVQVTQSTDSLVVSANTNNCTFFGWNISLDGHNSDMDFFIDRVTRCKINGTVYLKAGEIISFDGNALLEINGKVIGNNANGVIRFLTQPGNKCRITGQVKNLFAGAPAIVSQNGPDVPILILRGATIEVEATATLSIEVINGTLDFKMLGDSYSNFGIGGAGAKTYSVGSVANLVVDPDIEVFPY